MIEWTNLAAWLACKTHADSSEGGRERATHSRTCKALGLQLVPWRGDGAHGPGAGTRRWSLFSLSWALHEPGARNAGVEFYKKPEVLSGVTPG